MKSRSIKNQRGQFVVEGILIMVVFMGIVAMVGAFFSKNDVLKNLIKAPWINLAGMLQNSEWEPVQSGMARHPSRAFRHVTIDGVAP
jgi:hypothetical protein